MPLEPKRVPPRRLQPLGRLEAPRSAWVRLVVLGLLVAALPVLACRYNVRDLGFIELESESPRLIICLPPDTPASESDGLRRSAEAPLRDTNIRLELGRPGDLATEHARLADLWATNRLPAAALLSADGQVLAVPLVQHQTEPGGLSVNTLRPLVDSVTRSEIVREASRRFGVVLLIEGTDGVLNAAAGQAVREAVAEIRDSLARLPKAIAEPPAPVNLPANALLRERILLWSLGLSTDVTREPRAAVIYGKARWVGPIMNGPEISVGNLTRLFSIIGADCECGLDLAWTRGTVLPVRWEDAAHQAATRSLGFDPLDPLVQLEAGRILDRFSFSVPRARPTSGDPPPSLGSSDRLAATSDPGSVPLVAAHPPPPARIVSEPIWRTTWVVLGLLLAGVTLVGLWFWQRTTRR